MYHFKKKKLLSRVKAVMGVVDAATQQAKALLRKNQPFVWNATNITPQTRG